MVRHGGDVDTARGAAGAPCTFDDQCHGRCDFPTKTCLAHCGGS